MFARITRRSNSGMNEAPEPLPQELTVGGRGLQKRGCMASSGLAMTYSNVQRLRLLSEQQSGSAIV